MCWAQCRHLLSYLGSITHTHTPLFQGGITTSCDIISLVHQTPQKHKSLGTCFSVWSTGSEFCLCYLKKDLTLGKFMSPRHSLFSCELKWDDANTSLAQHWTWHWTVVTMKHRPLGEPLSLPEPSSHMWNIRNVDQLIWQVVVRQVWLRHFECDGVLL